MEIAFFVAAIQSHFTYGEWIWKGQIILSPSLEDGGNQSS
jgi:hypothetical protein